MQKEKRTCEDTARGSHVQAKERGLRRNKPAGTVVLDSQTPELWEVNVCCLKKVSRHRQCHPLVKRLGFGATQNLVSSGTLLNVSLPQFLTCKQAVPPLHRLVGTIK